MKSDANYVDTQGGRAQLKIDLGDNWTITPSIMGQDISTGPGPFGYNPAVGDLDTYQLFSDRTRDSWTQTALTIEGKVSDFDIVYSGGWLSRNTHESEDYTDYSLAYDRPPPRAHTFSTKRASSSIPRSTSSGAIIHQDQQ